MFERFTDQARAVVQGAVKHAGELGHHVVGTEHLLLALIASSNGIAHQVLTEAGLDADSVTAAIKREWSMDSKALESIGIDLGAVKAKVEEAFGPGALDLVPKEEKRGWFRKRRHSHKPFTARAKVTLELSLREAIALKHNYIGTEHILLGVLREGKGLAAKILSDSGIDFADLRAKTIAAVPRR